MDSLEFFSNNTRVRIISYPQIVELYWKDRRPPRAGTSGGRLAPSPEAPAETPRSSHPAQKPSPNPERLTPSPEVIAEPLHSSHRARKPSPNPEQLTPSPEPPPRTPRSSRRAAQGSATPGAMDDPEHPRSQRRSPGRRSLPTTASGRAGLAIAVLLLAGVVVYALLHLHLGRVGHALITATPGWIVLALALMGLSLVLRSVSWHETLRAALPRHGRSAGWRSCARR